MRKQVYTPWALVILISVIVITDGLFANSALLVVSGSFLLIVGCYGLLYICQNDTKGKDNTVQKESVLTGLKWYHFLFLIVSICGILVGPILFTRPSPFKYEWLDFSQTGDIGDTIGGITAPFVGFISILLLWWTLKEQLKFNEKQDQINNAQQALNDANRVLAMETHILRLDDTFHFVFSFGNGNRDGHGISDLRLLPKSQTIHISIPFSNLENAIAQVHIIESAVLSLICFLDNSKLSKEEKNPSYTMAETYLSQICEFYSNVINNRIDCKTENPADLHYDALGEDNPELILQNKCSNYKRKVDIYLSNCHQKLAE